MRISPFLRSTTGRNLLIASLFFVAGMLLMIQAQKQQTKVAQAQGGGDYSATWQATNLLVARLVLPDLSTEQKCKSINTTNRPYGDPINSETAIGPTRWEVRGVVDASTKFKEIWAAPTPPSSFTFGDGQWNTFWTGFCYNEKLLIVGNQSTSDWLLGFANNNDLGKSAIELRTVPVETATTSINNLEPGNVGNSGKTTSCQWTNRCIFTTGPYAWTTFHEFDEARNGKHFNLGMVMPVRWNVTGFICGPGETRCD
jgi:hypothetical protein